MSSQKTKELKKTTVPLGVEEIKEFFTKKNLLYVIDYSKSKLKDSVFLTYLSNLDLPFEVDFQGSSFEEKENLFHTYMTARNITQSDVLRINMAHILFTHRGIDTGEMFGNLAFSQEETKKFLEKHHPLLGKWENFLESTTLFAFKSIKNLNDSATIKENNEVVNDPQYVGVNVVNFFSMPSFMEIFFQAPIRTQIKYFQPQFEEYMFQGKNLYSFYSSKENTIFHFLLAILNRKVNIKDIENIYKAEQLLHESVTNG